MNVDPNPEKAVFLEAVERHAPDEWPAFLDRACADRADLRGRVEALLAAHREIGTAGHGDGAEGDRPAATADEPPIREGPGMAIGPYKLLEQIGEGGFGVVFMAEQTRPVRRKVALKVLRPGMGTRQVVARFEAERQALALMDHPNIAKVLDAGTTGPGRPYFVMELVQGVPITRFCDERRLTPKGRLELFVPVCQAVQHAHQKGIIHRDLKPSNVLVALYDGVPVPKVIDFGVAKAIGPRLTERTFFTEFGSVVGTLEYMSPEQAELNQLDVDTRSDIYSLGVLLYELLTGTTPLDRRRVKDSSLLDVLRRIREEEPPRPSARLSATDHLPRIAASRGLEPKKLKGLLRGELDWIVMRCLEKDRNRRYETADGLLLDLRRYLSDEPVQACPPSAIYRSWKFARRHRGPVLAAMGVAATLVAGIVGTSRGLIEAHRQRRVAQANLGKAHQAVNDYFTRVSESTLIREPTLEPLRRQLLHEAMRYYQEFVQDHGDDPELQAELIATYFRIAVLSYELSPQEDWLKAFEKGVAEMEKLARRRPSLANLAPLRGSFRWANTCGWWQVSRPADAIRALETACAIWQGLVREHPDVPGFRSDLAAFHLLLAVAQASHQRHEAVAKELRAADLLWQDLSRADPRPDYRIGLVLTRSNLAAQLALLGRSKDAESVGGEAVETASRLAADFPGVPMYEELLYTQACHVVGLILDGLGQTAAAEGLLRKSQSGQEALVRRYPTVDRYRSGLVRVHTDLAELLWASGQQSEAAGLFRRIRELGARLSPDDSASLDNLAWSLASAPVPELRDIPRAVAIAARSAERCPDGRNGWHTIAVARYRAGDYRAALEALERMMQRPDSFVGEAELFLAMALWQLGDRDAARAHYDRGVDWLDQHVIPISQVVRHRREAEALLGVGEPRRPARSPPRREPPRGSPDRTVDARSIVRP